MAIDYINTLGAGAGFNTKEIVSALVDAETSVSKARIESKIEDNDTKIMPWPLRLPLWWPCRMLQKN